MKEVKLDLDEWHGTVRLETKTDRLQHLGKLMGPVNVACYGFETVLAFQLLTYCCASPLSYSTSADKYYCVHCDAEQRWRRPFEQSAVQSTDRPHRLRIFKSWTLDMNVLDAELMAMRLDSLLQHCGELS